MFTSSIKAVAALMLAIGLMTAPAAAQQPANSSVSKGYMDAMSKMQSSMPKEETGDADKDFARMMIPHHQGAIDMSKVELQYGKDPIMKELAQKIVKESEQGIKDLKTQLDKK